MPSSARTHTAIEILVRTLSVVTGEMKRKNFSMAPAPPPPKRANKDAGNSVTSTGVAKNPFASSQNDPRANAVSHHAIQRFTVRAGTPSMGRLRHRRPAAATRPAMLATTTTAPTYTLRPRNLTDGGVAR